MRAVVTGANGFIGRNLCVRLGECASTEVRRITRESSGASLKEAVRDADIVFHLAGVNRAQDESAFIEGNVGFTRTVCEAIEAAKRRVPIVYSSTIHAGRDDVYGRSKAAAEEVLLDHHRRTGNPLGLFRLPNVFGKWCRPNYNSVVATFCHNLSRGLPIRVDDPSAPLALVYIDDVVDAFVGLLHEGAGGEVYRQVSPTYEITVGELEGILRSFAESRASRRPGRVGDGLMRALYATYESYLPPESFTYPLAVRADPRGTFAEVLRTDDSGQFSFLTVAAGATRGGHYHHTKTEKFVVLRGDALFRFRQIENGQCHEVRASGARPTVVETVPGWAHSVTNEGEDELVVLLWANELFDTDRPDTRVYP